MSTTIHGTACWECSDFNILNAMGEECEGNKHTFCDKSLAEHDAKVREDSIRDFADWEDSKCINYSAFDTCEDVVERYFEQLKENK